MTKKLLTICSLAVFAAAAVAAAKTLSVQTTSPSLRNSPSNLASEVTRLKLRDQLTLVEDRGDWKQVTTADGKSGWVHKSAVTESAVSMNSGDKDLTGGVTAEESAQASKGFSPEIENEYKKQHKELDFAFLDKMEKIKVSADEMRAFLKQGRLEAGKGGAK